jgi:UDP-N-acetylglucosamine 1-carboxyvinyltransferase
MGKYIIHGNAVISGEVTISGAKNSVLPIMTASLLTPEAHLTNVPHLLDVKSTTDILKILGCSCMLSDNTLTISSGSASCTLIPHALSHRLRSSILFMGAMLAKFHEASLAYPGGCDLGGRPVDMHIAAMEKMGVTFKTDGCMIRCKADKITGCNIVLPYPSVGVTENLILLATLADGTTHIQNAARESEISDLADFLNSAGAQIHGAGTSLITVTGVKALKAPPTHRIIPDRIEAGTFMAIAAATGGELYIKDVDCSQLKSVISVLSRAGAYISCRANSMYITAPKRLNSLDRIYTNPYPSLPTDMQAPLTSVFIRAKGNTTIYENVFSGRTGHIHELNLMGADISALSNSKFIISGVDSLQAHSVTASDLRAGAALIIAALQADGVTELNGIEHIKRGYDSVVSKLYNIGADIYELD